MPTQQWFWRISLYLTQGTGRIGKELCSYCYNCISLVNSMHYVFFQLNLLFELDSNGIYYVIYVPNLSIFFICKYHISLEFIYLWCFISSMTICKPGARWPQAGACVVSWNCSSADVCMCVCVSVCVHPQGY